MKVISNTGPIIALAKAGRLELLKALFSKVYVLPRVYKELAGKTSFEAEQIDRALNEFIVLENPGELSSSWEKALPGIDSGERQAIIRAYHIEQDVLLLLDDKAGRAVARRLNIPITGTVGVLLLAREQGLIESAGEVLEEMRTKGYWLSDEIIDLAKLMAGEK